MDSDIHPPTHAQPHSLTEVHLFPLVPIHAWLPALSLHIKLASLLIDFERQQVRPLPP